MYVKCANRSFLSVLKLVYQVALINSWLIRARYRELNKGRFVLAHISNTKIDE